MNAHDGSKVDKTFDLRFLERLEQCASMHALRALHCSTNCKQTHSYNLSCVAAGNAHAKSDAVLNTNYVRHRLAARTSPTCLTTCSVHLAYLNNYVSDIRPRMQGHLWLRVFPTRSPQTCTSQRHSSSACADNAQSYRS